MATLPAGPPPPLLHAAANWHRHSEGIQLKILT